MREKIPHEDCSKYDPCEEGKPDECRHAGYRRRIAEIRASGGGACKVRLVHRPDGRVDVLKLDGYTVDAPPAGGRRG